MSITYFIDSENVGDNWIALLDGVSKEDVILVFYTSKSPNMNYRNVILLKQSDMNVQFIDCFEGSNALDFQLCTELGCRISDLGEGEFIIVSNDTGFDAVVKYWRARNKAVKRIHGKACSFQKNNNSEEKADVKPLNRINDSGDKSNEAIMNPQEEIESLYPQDGLKESQRDNLGNRSKDSLEDKHEDRKDNASLEENKESQKEESNSSYDGSIGENINPALMDSSANGVDENSKEILYIIGKNNLQDLHESLKQLYGDKKSKSIYNTFKTGNAYNNFLMKHPQMNLKEKHTKYCSIVFSIMEPNEVMPEDFPEFIVDSWAKKKNLNSLKAMLQQKYGREKSDRYYSLFKVHIKILHKIK